MPRSNPNSLDLDGEDAMELLLALEAGFAVRFSPSETEQMHTVGDVLQALRRHIPSSDGQTGCATAMAFYRLRRVLTAVGISPPLTPTTSLNRIPLSARAITGAVGTHTGLRTPALTPTWMGLLGLLLILGLPTVLVYSTHAPLVLASLAGAGCGCSLIHFDPKRFTRAQTLGDLARLVAARNFARFVTEGAAPRDRDVWNALRALLAHWTITPQTEMRPETLLLVQNRPKRWQRTGAA